MGLTRRATAIWNGSGKEGSGNLTSTSGVLNNTPYSAGLRFANEDGKAGTNPEELIAAAHAGCFAMALSFGLGGAGLTPDELKATAHVQLDPKPAGGFEITGVTLEVVGKVPGATAEQFQQLATAAKEGCPVSGALKALPITLKATLA